MAKIYSLTEAAAESGFCVQHLRRLCRDRRVSHTRRGDRYFFTVEELKALTVHVAAVPIDNTPEDGGHK